MCLVLSRSCFIFRLEKPFHFANRWEVVRGLILQMNVVKSAVLPPICRAPGCPQTPWVVLCYPGNAKSLLQQLWFWSSRRGGSGLTRGLALALQVFLQVWPPGPSHEETPLSGSRGESCGLRGVKVEEPWAEGCVFQPKHAILHPTQLPPGPRFPEGLLRANKSCKNGIATVVRDVWGFLDSYTGI